MGENIQLHWGVSRVWAPTLDLLEDEERRILDISILQASLLRQMVFPWARLPSRLVEDHGDYQTTVEMPEAYLDALDELELALGGGYIPPEENPYMAERYVDLGNLAAFDWTLATLTANSAWHTLDMNSKINDGYATRAMIRVQIKDNATSSVFAIRPFGYSNNVGGGSVRTQVANIYNDALLEIYLVPGAVNCIEYYITTGMDVVNLALLGFMTTAVP